MVVVDDHPMFADTLALLLDRDERLDVVGTARSADEAVTVAATHEIDVVLLDLLLPDADGVEAARRVRTVRPDACVILVSGADVDELRPAATEAGAAAYVMKGGVDAELADTIVDLCGRQHADDLAGRDRRARGD